MIGNAGEDVGQPARPAGQHHSLQHVIHRLGDVIVAREARAMLPHPDLKAGEKGSAMLPPDRKTLFWRLAIDGAFNVEQGVDTTDCLEGQG